MDSKSILIINYYWPPSGGPAVQRWLDFTTRLANDNFNVHVLTIQEEYATFPIVDRTLVQNIHPNVQLHFAISSDWFGFYKKYFGKGKVPSNALADEATPNLLQKIARFIRGNFFIPDPRKGWNQYAFYKAEELIAKYSITTIVTAGPPQSTQLIGRALKRKLPIRWIADFHDYWSDLFFLDKFYRTKLASKIDQNLELSVLKESDIILTHREFGKNLYSQKLSSSHDSKIHIIRMGYDEKLFENYYPNLKQDILRLTYTGTLPDYYNSEIIFRSLKRVIQELPDLPIEINLVGTISEEVKKEISNLGLADICHFRGYVSHSESIEYIKNASILVLINPDVKKDQGIVPGKIFEYLATKNTIISIASHGSENEFLLNSLSAGKNFERTEESALTKYMIELFSKWQLDENLVYDQSNSLIPYSRAEEYQKLKSVLNLEK